MKNRAWVPCRALPLAASVFLFCHGAIASTDGEPADVPALPEVRIVAAPIVDENRVDAFGSLATVISEDQVRDLNAIDLSSALRRTPGVTVSRFNPVGSFGGSEGGAVYVRGLGASRPGAEIKTYVDGVPFYMGVWDHPLLDLLPVHSMGSIQVLKGPQPQRYGNNFAAIDLTPRDAPASGDRQGVQLAGGSYSTFVEQALASGRHGAFDYMVAQGYARSDGARQDGDGRLANGFARLGYQLDDAWSIGLTLLHADNRVSDPGQKGLPETRSGRFDTRGSLIALRLEHDHAAASGSMRVYSNQGRGNALDQPALDGDTLTDFTLRGLRWDETLRLWQGGSIAVGLDVDEIDGSVDFRRLAPAPMDYFSAPTLRVSSPRIAVGQRWEFGSDWSLSPSLGLRAYDHNVFASATAPHAGIVVAGPNVAFRVNAARGINYPGLGVVALSRLIPALGASWRDLKPERMDHLEAGFSVSIHDHASVDVALFQDNLKDRYVFAFPPAVTRPMFANLGDYRIRGAELTLSQQLGNAAEAFVGLTLLDPSLATLPYAPKRALSTGVNAQFGAWRTSIDAQYQGSMFVLGAERADGAANYASVGSFTTANVRIAHALPQLGRDGEVYVAVENLFDRDYAFRPGYPMPGRSGQLGIRVGF